MGVVLDGGLSLVESRELSLADTLLFLLLLLGELQFFVTSAPELSKLLVFLFGGSFFFLESLNLKLTTSFNGELHLHLSALLLFEKSVGFVFGFGDVFVEDLLLVVLDSTELTNLPVDHAATLGLLFSEALRFLLFFHQIAASLLFSELFNLLFFLEFLAARFILE